MRLSKWLTSAITILCFAVPAALAAQDKTAAPTTTPTAPPGLDKTVCLGCHGNEGFGMPDAEGKMRVLFVNKDKFLASVHGKRECVECHQDITSIV